jgi:hypothetical protein
MIARMRDPIDGCPGPLPPSEVKALHGTSTARPRRQKGAYVHDPVGGRGEWRQIPPPTPSEVMPRYDTYNRLRAPAALQ